MRRWLSGTLVVLASLLVVISTVAVWTQRTALDTDKFMAAVEPTLDNPAVYTAMGDIVSDQTLAALDLEERVAGRLGQLDEYLAAALSDAVDGDRLERLPLGVERPTLEALAPPISTFSRSGWSRSSPDW